MKHFEFYKKQILDEPEGAIVILSEHLLLLFNLFDTVKIMLESRHNEEWLLQEAINKIEAVE
jgi:hypothetical protein